ncbi:8-oxoguanine deaminase [Methylobacterium brachiatum]|uniref:8-oxoguanine deaminase n=1 Tax=Methylobacterium brachiatum TaxID=269660 RepID=A0AAJ1WXH0_9HYPH|nr:8-oxoguanine deaminase [Methylobacterium brachiatum]MCB4801657.1 8-oxoguanine deaminase [Methylobacterium brachiatum]MDQ0544810.1 8-oxoguanine deaminase [Methylobacterium brachiatum]
MSDADARARRVWIRDPLAILAAEAGGGIVVAGSRIVERVAVGAQPAAPVDETFDASRHVVIPGLVNTHHHAFQTLTRAHPIAINKPLFPWLKALYTVWGRITPEAFRLATRVAYTELLLSGCTTAGDHHYLFPKGLEQSVDIQVEEARSLGIRAAITRGSMSLSDREGGLPPETLTQDDDTILADCERVLNLFHDPAPGAMVQVGLAPCSPFAVTKRLMRESADLAARHGCRLHTHLGETLDEDQFCLSMFGCRPVDYLEEVGWMSDRVWLAHGIHFNDAEVARLGKAGVGVCHCPTSNMTLASGHCRTCELEAAGSPVGLGVDGSASNDSSNLMEGVRHALMLNRLTYGAETVTHLDALRWATEGSAACLGRSDIGRIEPGREADLALFTLDELRFSGAHDPLAALVLCGATRADRVMVAGQWRVIDGQPLGVDAVRLREDHSRLAKALFGVG